MNVELDIQLHENQKLIDSSEALYKVAKCGKRFGKTVWAIFALTREAGATPGGVFWYIAPTYRQAKNIAWRKFKKLIPPKYIKRMVENELLIELVNGSMIQLIGADNEDSLRGPELNGVVFDEVAYTNKYIWNNIIRGQLLGSDGRKQGFAWFISSPLNPAETMGKDKEDWYPEFYQEAKRKQDSGDKNWAAFHFSIYDNPKLSKDQIDEIKKDNTDDAWGVEYMANESAHAGQIYSEFRYEQHVMECRPGVEAMLIRGHDWGISHPTACLWVYADFPNKRIYFEDEYLMSGNLIHESVDVIKKKTGNRQTHADICDPSMAKRNSQTPRRDMDEYARLGIACMAGDNGNRGYNIMKMMLKTDVIRVSPKCRLFIKQLKDLQWSHKVGDDLTDCARYVCVYIHDILFNWKDLEEGKKKEEGQDKFTPAYLAQRRECNINNKFMFPDEKKPDEMSWLREEAEAY